jgi:hypothetical protein
MKNIFFCHFDTPRHYQKSQFYFFIDEVGKKAGVFDPGKPSKPKPG